MPNETENKQNPDAATSNTTAPDTSTDSAACPPSAQVPRIGQTGAGNPSPGAASRTGGATTGVAPESNPDGSGAQDKK